jgi:hypothetical protein
MNTDGTLSINISQRHFFSWSLYFLRLVFAAQLLLFKINLIKIIYRDNRGSFRAYLHDVNDYANLVDWDTSLLEQSAYDALYQLARFHPNYYFPVT